MDSSSSSVIIDLTSSKSKKKRARDVQEAMESAYQKAITSNAWIKDDKPKFMSSGDYFCTYCKCSVSCATVVIDDDYNIVDFTNNSGNIGKHIKKEMHQKAAAAEARREGKNPNVLTSYIPILLGAPSSLYHEEMGNLRALVNASIVAAGINPHQAEQLFSSISIICQGIKVIQKYTPDFSTESKIEADMDKAELMIDDALKELLRGQSMSLVSDSATFKHNSIIVVLASCSKIDTPVVLSIITPEEKSSNEDDDT
jgi:hypothetical protein